LIAEPVKEGEKHLQEGEARLKLRKKLVWSVGKQLNTGKRLSNGGGGGGSSAA